jgi:hypothetical protein
MMLRMRRVGLECRIIVERGARQEHGEKKVVLEKCLENEGGNELEWRKAIFIIQDAFSNLIRSLALIFFSH